MAKAIQQVELARLTWRMQEARKDPTLDEQREYNHAMRECYQEYVRIIGKADVEGWEKFALFVLGYKPDLDLSTPEGEIHATDRS